jgi:signal peptidase I
VERTRRVIAIVLGILLWPGAGHMYVGRWRHGIAWFAACWAVLLLIPVWFPFLWIGLLLKLLHVVDLGFVPLGNRPRHWWLVVVGGLAVTFVMSLVIRSTIMEAFKIPSSGMEPTFQIGDHVFVDKWNASDVSPGEIVVFRNPCTPTKAFIKRIVARPGDTVEVRCHVLFVNGQPVPRELVDADDHYDDVDVSIGVWSKELASRWREQIGGVSYEVFHSEEAAIENARDSHDFPIIPDAPTARLIRPPVPRCPDGEALGEIVKTRDDAGDCEPQVHYVVPPGTVFVMGDNRQNSSDSRTWGPVPLDHVIGRVIGIWWSSGNDGVRWGRIGTSF